MERKKENIELLINRSIQDKQALCQSVKETVPAVPKQKPLVSLQSTIKDSPDNTVLNRIIEEKNPNSLPERLCEQKEKVTTKFVEAALRPENDDGQVAGIDETRKEAGVKENMGKANKKSPGNVGVGRISKKRDGEKTIHNDAEADKASLHGSPTHTGDNLDRNKIKGKVKEFVKMFNQEAPSKHVSNANTQSQSFRWKDAGTFKAEKEVNVSTTRADETQHTPNIEKNKISVNTHVKKTLEPSRERGGGELSSTDITIRIISNAYEQKDSSSSTASITDGSKATLVSIDDFFEDNFSIKELSEDQNKPPQSNKDEEDFNASDAKIRGWSKGKETNIRSLLSTLQYVLWPESGWKPVPLVDIIEGNAVKRSYQRALLCLHPDKLQQKGAAAHQKYVAEKVFDILQDAWTPFNSLGLL